MNIKQRLKAVLQEAEIYRSQGLIAEAQGKYKEAAHLVDSIAKLKNKERNRGKATPALIEERETYPEINRTARNTPTQLKVRRGFNASNTPKMVATPFPPLNPANTG